MQTVRFSDDDAHRLLAAEAFERHRSRLRSLLPYASVEHVGSSSIPGALTKGDLDIQVTVAAEDFRRAEAALASRYMRNTGSVRIEGSFASFEDNSEEPPLGIQLTVEGGEVDCFRRFRDLLRGDPQLVDEYNRLKAGFQGGGMDEYRRAKSEFIERVLRG